MYYHTIECGPNYVCCVKEQTTNAYYVKSIIMVAIASVCMGQVYMTARDWDIPCIDQVSNTPNLLYRSTLF